MLPLHLLAHAVEDEDRKDERDDVVADERREEDAIDCRLLSDQNASSKHRTRRRTTDQPPIADRTQQHKLPRTFEVEDGEVGDVGQRHVERQEEAQHPDHHQRVQQVPRDELRRDFRRPKQQASEPIQ